MDRDIFTSLVSPLSMTSQTRIHCLFDSLEYVRNLNIDGDYVECGVWKGGNILGIIKYLENYNVFRNIWLYDTFKGMTKPQDVDINHNNDKAEYILSSVLCCSTIDEVKYNLSTTAYPQDKIKFIVGDVCETLIDNENVPNKIAFLRLDTDWYSSTKIELEKLWPKLEIGAPCIIDDYGHWKGCKKAVDEFFNNLPIEHEFEHIDYTGIRVFRRC